MANSGRLADAEQRPPADHASRKRFQAGSVAVVLDPDVASALRSSESNRSMLFFGP